MVRLSSTLLASAAIALLCAPPVLAQPANCAGSGARPRALGGPVRVGVTPPPPLPPEEQPPAPGYGYMWTPGYWGWNNAVNDYYWIPGDWMAPPAVGLLWTPPWWAWDGAVFAFQPGYWGPTVGFYGGVNYGYGYFGHGYDGGYWRGRTLFYNHFYNNLGALRVNAVYERRALLDRGDWRRARPSYSGGRGGVVATPTSAEILAGRQAHVFATAAQARRWTAAANDRTLRAGVNGGRPHLAAAHPGAAVLGIERPNASSRPVNHPALAARLGAPAHHAPHPLRIGPTHLSPPIHHLSPPVHHAPPRSPRAADNSYRFNGSHSGSVARVQPAHHFEAPVMRAPPRGDRPGDHPH